MPKRLSLPSMLPPAWPPVISILTAPPSASCGVPACSLTAMVPVKTTSRISIAAKMALPCLVFLTPMPKVKQQAAGISSRLVISMMLVKALGFSYGWAEFTPKKPPPLVPDCLMATWGAAGPWGRNCSVTTRAPSTTSPSTLTVSPSIWAPSTTLQPPSALGRTATGSTSSAF